MAASPSQSQLAQWKRTFFAGWLSAIVAGIFLFGAEILETDIVMLLSAGFSLTTFVSLSDPSSQIFLSMLFWFMAGALIAHLNKDNKKAFRHGLVYILLSLYCLL